MQKAIALCGEPQLTIQTKGVAIGHYYAYAQHQCQWAVRYLVKLDLDSPSIAWTVADTAWEEDLEPATENDGRSWEVEEAKEKMPL
jgi:hypothetical protein